MIEPPTPGNIRFLPSICIGNNRGFCVFRSVNDGLKQMLKQLQIYFDRDNLKTIRGILMKYAPPIENNTEAYINFVSQKSGFAPGQVLTRDQLIFLLPPMLKMESGSNYTVAQIQNLINANPEPGPEVNFGNNFAPLFLFTIFGAWIFLSNTKKG